MFCQTNMEGTAPPKRFKRGKTIASSVPANEEDHIVIPFNSLPAYTDIMNNLTQGRSVILHGPFQSGKTSLLEYIDRTLRQDRTNLVCFMDPGMNWFPGDKEGVEKFWKFMSFGVIGLGRKCVGREEFEEVVLRKCQGGLFPFKFRSVFFLTDPDIQITRRAQETDHNHG